MPSLLNRLSASLTASDTDDRPVRASGAARPVDAFLRGPQARRPSRAEGALVLALVAAMAYAAFAHGAIAPGDAGPLETGLAVAVAGWAAWRLLDADRRPPLTRTARAGVSALVALSVWSALSMLWSVAPDRSWLEFNQAGAYAAVAGLGLAVGRSGELALRRLAVGYLSVACAVALYALGGKVVPGLEIPGLLSLNHTADIARLRAPLDYWNALGLLCALAAPVALRLSVEPAIRSRGRVGALLGLSLLLACGALTYSRGAVLALVVGLAVSLRLGGRTASSLGRLGLAMAGALPAVTLGFADHRLVDNRVPLASREAAGLVFGLALVVGLGAVGAVGRRAPALSERPRTSPQRRRAVRRAALAAVVVIAVLGLGAVAASSRGLTGTISHSWHAFTDVREDRQGDPGRLLTTNSGNRWVWWQEALGASSARPLAGWGAGSFPVTHLLFRHNTLQVLQPHSVALQFLAEDGLIGAILAAAGLLVLGSGAVGTVRRLAPGPEQALAAAALGAVLAWAAHGFFDWDWDIPGVTVPALALLGALVGRGSLEQLPAGSPDDASPSTATRVWGLGAVWVSCLIFAVSALMPAFAQSLTGASLGRLPPAPSPTQLRDAAARASLAARLDPLAVEPVLAQAAIAARRGQQLQARALLLKAIARQPYSELAWLELTRVELARLDLVGTRRAAGQALLVDPSNPTAQALAAQIETEAAPGSLSATATGTPLSRTR